MDFSTTQLLLAFVEGIGLIASPCILPILPIMLAASLDGGKRRPLGIITGFIGAFTAFALLSRQVLEWLDADPEIVRNVALGLLIVFGLIMLSKKLSDKLLGVTQGLANFGNNLTMRWDQKHGYFSGVAIGALIGLIWTPCAGPIMAAAIVQIIQAKSSSEAALTVAMFALGAGIPMLAIALMGRQIMARLNFLKTHSYGVRRVLGVIIILTAVLIYQGADVQLLAASGSKDSEVIYDGKLQGALQTPYLAPEITGTQGWINSQPLKIADLRGKVVLIDFWTYSCINCVRTMPYITKWDAKYRDKGLVIIGVHSPEFEFEKKPDNVQAATVKFGIRYPVALDNNLETWGNFQNKYWPAHYLIDQEGRVVYTHFGEGEYARTENNIRILLGLGPEMGEGEVSPASPAQVQTPETYLGYQRGADFVSSKPAVLDQAALYEYPAIIPLNNWGLSGEWMIEAQRITSTKEKAALRLHFTGKNVFLVLGSKNGSPIHVRVSVNDQPAQSVDVKDGMLTVDRETLYELIDQESAKEGVLELQAVEPGLQAYAFTFGG
ncbi:MAG: cytochrome c biogenesis protein DipZ [Alphaproteobacteria bacterium]